MRHVVLISFLPILYLMAAQLGSLNIDAAHAHTFIHLGAKLVGVLQQHQVETAAVHVIGIVLADALLTLGEANVDVAIGRDAAEIHVVNLRVGGRRPGRAKLVVETSASSILGRKSRSLNTRVEDGTSDSPTCSRGINSRSNTTQFTPFLARYAAMLDPAGPPPIMPTSKSGADEFMSAAFSPKMLSKNDVG